MKKNYIKPEMKVYEIETPHLLPASDSEKLRLRNTTEDSKDEWW